MPGIYSRHCGLLHSRSASNQHRGLSSSSSLLLGSSKQQRYLGSKGSGRTSAASSQRSNDSSQGSYRSNMSIPRNSRAHDFLLSPRTSFDSRGTNASESTPVVDTSDDWGYFVDCDPVLYTEAVPMILKNPEHGSIPETPQEGMILEL